MKFRLSALVFALGAICCLPFMLWLVDVWTWIVFGQGITPIEWIIPKERGYDPIGKVLMTFLFLVGGIFIMAASHDIYMTEKRNEE